MLIVEIVVLKYKYIALSCMWLPTTDIVRSTCKRSLYTILKDGEGGFPPSLLVVSVVVCRLSSVVVGIMLQRNWGTVCFILIRLIELIGIQTPFGRAAASCAPHNRAITLSIISPSSPSNNRCSRKHLGLHISVQGGLSHPTRMGSSLAQWLILDGYICCVLRRSTQFGITYIVFGSAHTKWSVSPFAREERLLDTNPRDELLSGIQILR